MVIVRADVDDRTGASETCQVYSLIRVVGHYLAGFPHPDYRFIRPLGVVPCVTLRSVQISFFRGGRIPI